MILALWLLGGTIARRGRWSANRDSDHVRPRLPAATFARLENTGNRIGSDEASVVIVVFNDYRCGFCARLNETLTELRERYPDHVAVVSKSFVAGSDRGSLRAALGAECAAAQGAFARFHAAAFANQALLEDPEGWKAVGDSARIPKRTEFVKCVRLLSYGDKVTRDTEDGRGLGVTATPASFVNGVPVMGAAPFAVFDSIISGEFPRRQSKKAR